jgi:SOS-response transcriptional repressor LexA
MSRKRTPQTPPTQRQLDVYAFMWTYQVLNGMPPTMREIMQKFGFVSTNAASSHLRAMTLKGMLRCRPHTARAYLALPLQREGVPQHG